MALVPPTLRATPLQRAAPQIPTRSRTYRYLLNVYRFGHRSVPPADIVNTAVLPTEFIWCGTGATTATRRRPEANEIAKDTIAKVKVTIEAYTAALLAAANCVALTFAPSFRQ